MGTQLGHGDERPPHPVYVDPFELGVCPVTRAEYERFVDATGHEPACDRSEIPPVPSTACDAPRAGARGAMRTRSAASRCAASSIRPFATMTLDSASREAERALSSPRLGFDAAPVLSDNYSVHDG